MQGNWVKKGATSSADKCLYRCDRDLTCKSISNNCCKRWFLSSQKCGHFNSGNGKPTIRLHLIYPSFYFFIIHFCALFFFLIHRQNPVVFRRSHGHLLFIPWVLHQSPIPASSHRTILLSLLHILWQVWSWVRRVCHIQPYMDHAVPGVVETQVCYDGLSLGHLWWV